MLLIDPTSGEAYYECPKCSNQMLPTHLSEKKKMIWLCEVCGLELSEVRLGFIEKKKGGN